MVRHRAASRAARQGAEAIRITAQTTRAAFPANLVVGNDVLGECSKYFSLDAWADKTLPFLIVPKASVCEKNLKTRPNGNPFTPYASKTFHAAGNTHPTVKPLKLMTYLVALGSRPGDLVLDPFLGSGTTAVAAKLLGRRYIGIERESRYLAIARRRVATC
ncbi:MAG: site-specific DNA-methyltransferase [Rhizomicrobium sp.]